MGAPVGGVGSAGVGPLLEHPAPADNRWQFVPRWDKIGRFAWAGPAAVMFAVGLWGIGGVAAWRDEMATWWAATLPAPDALRLVGNVDAVLAPYYLVMRLWVLVAGDSTTALRLPSLAAMVGTAALVTVLGRRLFGLTAGLLAGTLFALVPGVSAYAQEARPYAMVTLAVTGATLLLLRAMERRTWGAYAAYAGCVVVVGLLHLLALVILVAHLVAVLTTERDRRGAVRRWLSVTQIAVLLVAMFAFAVRDQRGQVDWLPEPTLQLLVRTPAVVMGSALGAVLLIALAGVGIALAVVRRRLDHRTALLVGWAVLPPLTLWVISFGEKVFYFRYVTFVVPAVCLLAAGAVWRLGQGRDRRVLAAGGLAVVVFAGVTVGDHRDVRWPLHKQGFSYADMVAPIVADFRPGDAVAYTEVDAPYFIRLGAEYEFSRQGIRPREVFVGVPAAEAGSYLSIACPDVATCRSDVADVDRIWLVRLADLADPLAGYPDQVETVLREDFTVAATFRTVAADYPPPLNGATVALLVRTPSTNAES